VSCARLAECDVVMDASPKGAIGPRCDVDLSCGCGVGWGWLVGESNVPLALLKYVTGFVEQCVLAVLGLPAGCRCVKQGVLAG
jgi:hypothetical protein